MEEDWSIYSGDVSRDKLVEDAMTKIGPGKPVIIMNLLRFREYADYQGLSLALTSDIVKNDTSEMISGEAVYFGRYIPAYEQECAQWFPDTHGKEQKIICLSKDMMPLLNYGRVPEGYGGERDYWHAVIVLQYPSFEKAMEFQKSESYWRAAFHRAAALEDNVAWVMQSMEVMQEIQV